MRCDIIIPVWNQLEFTKGCIDALVRNTRYLYRLIVIDNASDDETRSYLEGLKDVPFMESYRIKNDKNAGFVKAVNQGLAISNAPYVCILNNDTIPAPGWLENMVGFAEANKDIGLMNPLCNGHGEMTIEEYAATIGRNKGAYMEMNQCQGFCMLIKREVIEEIGYLDESFGMGCYDDTDYSMRAHLAGYRCASVHSSYVYHKENVSFNALGKRKIHEDEGEKRYLEKWPRHLRVAIAFNINNDGVGTENFLRLALSMARDWCWVNAFIFGDARTVRQAVSEAGERIAMPHHQNIKLNFLPIRFKGLQVAARVIERSLGTKSRKRYDILIIDNKDEKFIMELLRVIHRARVLDFNQGAINKAVNEIRTTHNAQRTTKDKICLAIS